MKIYSNIAVFAFVVTMFLAMSCDGKHKQERDERVISWAIMKDDVATVEEALRRNPRAFIQGRSVLYYALLNGSVDMVETVISSGVNINEVNSRGGNPLQIAVFMGWGEEILVKMIDNGGYVNMNCGGDSLLSSAIKGGRYNAANVLIKHGGKLKSQEEMDAVVKWVKNNEIKIDDILDKVEIGGFN